MSKKLVEYLVTFNTVKIQPTKRITIHENVNILLKINLAHFQKQSGFLRAKSEME